MPRYTFFHQNSRPFIRIESRVPALQSIYPAILSQAGRFHPAIPCYDKDIIDSLLKSYSSGIDCAFMLGFFKTSLEVEKKAMAALREHNEKNYRPSAEVLRLQSLHPHNRIPSLERMVTEQEKMLELGLAYLPR